MSRRSGNFCSAPDLGRAMRQSFAALFPVSCALLLVLSSVCIVRAAEPEGEVLQPGTGVTKIAGDCKFTEGPSVDRKGDLYFSDGPNDRIMKLATDGKLSVFRAPCGRTNGTKFDVEGRLVCGQSAGPKGGRRVVRIERDGTETVLAATFQGKPFIAPNDLCIDQKGRVYFTDPWFGAGEKSQSSSGVYRIDAPGKVVRVVSNLGRPNGILITPDNKTIYISDRLTQKLHRYTLQDDGSLQPNGVLYDFSPDRGIDGMCLDVKGNVYGAAGEGKTTGLFVISPTGKLLRHQPLPEFATNATFGGQEMRTLYMTAGKSIYKLQTRHRGVVAPLLVP